MIPVLTVSKYLSQINLPSFPYLAQKGHEKYQLAATSEQDGKKKSKGKKKEKDMDELKKEVDLVCVQCLLLYWYQNL